MSLLSALINASNRSPLGPVLTKLKKVSMVHRYQIMGARAQLFSGTLTKKRRRQLKYSDNRGSFRCKYMGPLCFANCEPPTHLTLRNISEAVFNMAAVTHTEVVALIG